jgi:outer membrane lipoprotein carrier protein
LNVRALTPALSRKRERGTADVAPSVSFALDNARSVSVISDSMRASFDVLLFAAFAAFSSSTHAADSARARMQAFSHDLKSVTADFTQSVTDANGHRGDESQGSMALQAPRLFRWETKKPYEQTIVADGKRVWVYELDLQQVSVRSQSSEEAHSPLTVLTDLSQLDTQFTASESGERDGLVWLKLASKAKEPEFEYAELGFSAATLDRMLFKDQLGNTTEIRFSDWKRNPSIPADTFKFTPPKGVDVIGDTDPGAEIYPIKD